MFQKLDVFFSSGEKMGRPPQLGLFERANFIHWTISQYTKTIYYAKAIE
jgi:hypothetical protein